MATKKAGGGGVGCRFCVGSDDTGVCDCVLCKCLCASVCVGVDYAEVIATKYS